MKPDNLPKFLPKRWHTKQQTVKILSAWSGEQRSDNILKAALMAWPLVPLVPEHAGEMVLACYGPSLSDNLDGLRSETGHRYTVSGAHDLLVSEGIEFRGHIEADPRPHKAEFIRNPAADVSYLMASSCSGDVFHALHGSNVWLWHVLSTDVENDLIFRCWPEAFIVSCGTNVGMSAIALGGEVLGYRKFRIYGMDCSFKASEQLAAWPRDKPLPENLRDGTRFHAGPHGKEDQSLLRVALPDGGVFITSAQMLQSVQDFLWLRVARPDWKIELVGDGLLKALVNCWERGMLGNAHVPLGQIGTGRVTFHL